MNTKISLLELWLFISGRCRRCRRCRCCCCWRIPRVITGLDFCRIRSVSPKKKIQISVRAMKKIDQQGRISPIYHKAKYHDDVYKECWRSASWTWIFPRITISRSWQASTSVISSAACNSAICWKSGFETEFVDVCIIVCDSTWGITSIVLNRLPELPELPGSTTLPAFDLTEEVLESYRWKTMEFPDVNKYSYMCLLKLVQIELIIIHGDWRVIR